MQSWATNERRAAIFFEIHMFPFCHYFWHRVRHYLQNHKEKMK